MKKRPDRQSDKQKDKPNGKRDLHAEQLEPRLLYSAAPAEAPAPEAPAAQEAAPAETQQAAPAPAPAPEAAPSPAPDAAAPAPAPEAAPAPVGEQAQAAAEPQQATPAAEAPAADASGETAAETETVLDTQVVVLPEEDAVAAAETPSTAEEALAVVDESGNVIVEAAIVAPAEVAADSSLIAAPATAQVNASTLSQPQITQQVVEQIAAAASDRWHATGLTDEQSAALANVRYELAELSGTKLGVADGNVVTIDTSGGDRGWFVDSTPLVNEEFSSGPGEVTMIADPNSDADERYDLLSVILHEQGHLLGLHDLYTPEFADSVMYAGTSAGERILPVEGEAEGAIAGSIEGPVYDTFNVTAAAGDGTAANQLRGAIIAANASIEDDTIMLDAGTFNLTVTGGGGTNGQNGGDLDVWKREGTLTIVGQGTGTTTIDASALNDRVFQIHAGANLILQDLTITGASLNNNGAGLYVDHANVTLIDVEISGNTAAGTDRDGGGFYATGHSTVTLQGDVAISGNTATGDGGGFFATEFAVVDGSLANSVDIKSNLNSNNRTDRSGGGFFANSWAQISLNNADISDNGSTVFGNVGGGFYASNRASVTITSNGGTSQIHSNDSRSSGGGFYAASQATIDLTGVKITDNQSLDTRAAAAIGAGGQGGGFYSASALTTVTIDGGEISGNTSGSHGGGFSNRGTVTITGADIKNNVILDDGLTKQASGARTDDNLYGGGFYNEGLPSSVTLTDVDVTGNTSAGTGGGFHNVNGLVTFNGDTSVSDNRIRIEEGANRVGGGFYNAGAGQVTFNGRADIKNNADTSGNFAHGHGGGFYNAGDGIVKLLGGGEISGHTLESGNGGGFYTTNGGRVELSNVDIKSNTAATDGGGFYLGAGTRTEIIDRTVADATQADGFARVRGGAVIMNGGIIGGVGTGNRSGGVSTDAEGGGFFNSGGIVEITGADITYNQAGKSSTNNEGGGFYTSGITASVKITDGSVDNNSAYGNGAGFWANDTSVEINGAAGKVSVSGNKSLTTGRDGGGFEATGESTINITNAEIHDNIATNDGGGFHIEYGTIVELSEVTIKTNTATQMGGGFATRTDQDHGLAQVRLINSAANRANAISGNVTLNEHGGGFMSRGFVHIENADITNNRSGINQTDNNVGGGFYLEDNSAYAEIIDSHITGNTAIGRGGGFYVSHSALTIQSSDGSDINITGNVATNNSASNARGGGFWASGSSILNLKNTVIDKNTADGHGGGFNASNDANITILGGSLSGNTVNKASQDGGGFFAEDAARIEIRGTGADKFEIKDNISPDIGGGFYADDRRNEVILEHVTVQDNTSGATGGGFRSAGALTISDSVITENTASNHGGGFVNTGQATLTRVDITKNETLGTGTNNFVGGGFYQAGAFSRILLDDVKIEDNEAHGAGAGFYNNAGVVIGTVTANDALTIKNNEITAKAGVSSNHDGGGFYNTNNGVVELSRAEISGNTAKDEGGGFYSTGDGSRVVLDEVKITGNQSRINGGGFYNSNSGSQLVIRDSDTGNAFANVISNNVGGFGAAKDQVGVRTNIYGGGGFAGGGKVDISDVTISGNTMLAFPGWFNPSGTDEVPEQRDWRAGGLFIGGSAVATLTNAEISGNTAFGYGGGLYNAGRLVASNLTVTKNVTKTDVGNKDWQGGGIYSSGWLEITDSTITENTANGSGGGLRTTNYAKLDNVTVSNNLTHENVSTNRVGGGIYVSGDSRLILVNGTTVDNNKAGGQGGGIYNNGASITMTGGSVSGNTITATGLGGQAINRDGGGIYHTGIGYLELNGVAVDNNTATAGGGGIGVASYSHTEITGGTVSGNDGGTTGGGGIRVQSDAVFLVDGTTIAKNTTTGRGGGFFQDSSRSQVEIRNALIDNNQATVSGGGLNLWNLDNSRSSTKVIDTDIVNNTVTSGHGGGVYLWRASNLEMEGVTISDNTTQGSGGNDRRGAGMYLDGSSALGTVKISDSTISDNTSYGRGGGIYSNQVQMDINRSSITGNQTSADNEDRGRGGGIWVDHPSSVVNINESLVANNQSVGHGGGFWHDNGVLNLNNSTVSGNVAGKDAAGSFVNSRDGGGFWTHNADAFLNINHSTIADNDSTRAAGGIRRSSAVITVTDSIVADNQENVDAVANDEDILGAYNVEGTSIVETDTIGGAHGGAGTLLTADPGLQALANNGGPTLTQAILSTSNAANAATGAAAPAVDQRGVFRPQGAARDIGAFELEGGTGAGPAITALTATTLANGGEFAEPGDTIDLSVTAAGGSNFNWIVVQPDGTTAMPGAGAMTTFAPTQAGEHTFYVNVDDGTSTRNSQAVTFNVAAVTTVAATADGTVGGTLREAVNNAQAADSSDVEIIRLTTSGTPYSLTIAGTDAGIAYSNATRDSGDLDISKYGQTIIIEGATANAADTVIDVDMANARGFQVFHGAKLVLRNLTVSGATLTNSHGGGIYNHDGEVILENVVLADNTADLGGQDRRGGGFYNTGHNASFSLTDSEITGNTAGQGGGFFNSNGTVILDNTKVNDNHAVTTNRNSHYGGGFYASGASTVTLLNDVEINDNTSPGRRSGGGAGFYALGLSQVDGSSANSISIQGNHFNGSGSGSNNQGDGGGFYATNWAKIDLKNATVAGNGFTDNNNNGKFDAGDSDAQGRNGGGFYTAAFAQLTIDGGSITDNYARSGGGGFYNDSRLDQTLTNVTLQNNSGTIGGGFYDTSNFGTIKLTGSADISGNVARTSHGGAFYTQGVVEIDGMDITGNTAGDGGDDRGGGFYTFYRTADVTLKDADVTGNKSSGWGAGFNSESFGSVTFTNNALTSITGNEVTANGRGGAGFAIHNSGVVTIDGAFDISSNISKSHGGGFYNSGGLVVAGSNAAKSSISNHTLANNNNYHGGGFYNINGGVVQLTNTDITDNTASFYGGGFYSDTSITNVTDFFDQGALATAVLGYVGNTNTNVAGGQLLMKGNASNGRSQSNAHGGGFFNAGTVEMNGVDITENQTLTGGGTGQAGGGFFNNSHRAVVKIEDGNVTKNTAGGVGGGFYNFGMVEFTTSANATTSFDQNKAGTVSASDGGGFYNTLRGKVSIEDARFTANSATSDGGGFFTRDMSFVELTNGTEFTGNTATGDGGGFYSGGDSIDQQYAGAYKLDANGLAMMGADGRPEVETEGVRITDSVLISGNTADSDGGGFNARGSVFLENVQIKNNTAAAGVGGGFRADGWAARITIDNSSNAINDGDITGNTSFSFGGGFDLNEGEVTIIGAAADRVQISSNKQTQVANDRTGGGFRAVNSANVTLTDVDITANTASGDNGGGFSAENDATVIGTNVDITNNRQERDRSSNGGGGGFFLTGRSTVELENTKITGNYSKNNGGGFRAESTDTFVKISGTGNQLNSNTALDEWGGGFYSVGTVEISNATIDKNTAGGSVGGGFRIDGPGASATLTDVNVTNNTAASNGAGFYAEDGQLSITGTTTPVQITGNTHSKDGRFGGGGLGTNNIRISITNAEITGNTATDSGGGLALGSTSGTGVMTLTNVKVNNNQARDEGGGLYFIGDQNVVDIKSTGGFQNEIVGNETETSAGGGISNRGQLTINNTKIADNIADNQGGTINLATTVPVNNDARLGGGIYSTGTSTVTLNDTNVTNNRGGLGAGIGIAGTTTLTVRTAGASPTEISDNRGLSTDRAGGGLYFQDTSFVDLENVTLDNNISQSYGGGFYGTSNSKLIGKDITISNNTVERTDRSGGGFGAASNAVVDLTNATIDNNTAGSEGGGFWGANDARVELDTVSITDNTTLESHGGGFRYGQSNTGGGHVIGTDVLISGNEAAKNQSDKNSDDSNVGGGFYTSDADTLVDFTRVEITNNDSHGRGGGFYNAGPTVKLTDFAIVGNTADQGTSESQGRGGGIWNSSGGQLILQNGEIAENEAFGHGGGIYQRDTNSALYAQNVTISGNKAGVDQTGGGWVDTRVGGGVWIEGSGSNQVIVLNHVTITDNYATRNGTDTGAGIRVDGGSTTLSLENSIVFGNFRDADGTQTPDDIDNNIGARFTVLGANVLGEVNGAISTGNVAGITNDDPFLGALAVNGATVQLPSGAFARTHTLGAGSSAIDAAPALSTLTGDILDLPALGGLDETDHADNTGVFGNLPTNGDLTEDQRGYARPQGTMADIGALEMPAVLYVDDDEFGVAGASVDGDLEEAGVQSATVGIDAFASINDALAVYTVGKGRSSSMAARMPARI